MKYCLVLSLMACQIAAFGQKNTCLIVAKSITKNEALTYELINKYNNKQQLVLKEERFLGNEMFNYTTSYRFIYDEKGNVIETINYFNGKFNRSVYQKFDEQNQLVEEAILTNKDGKKNVSKIVNANETILLDADGNTTKILVESLGEGQLLKETVYNMEGKPTNVKTLKYNKDGEVAERSETDILRNRVTTTTFNRTPNGVITEEITLIDNEPFRKIRNSLNSIGDVSEKRVFNRNDQLDYTISYTYDDRKKVTSESYFYNEELITETENTYDSIGNLVQQDNFERGKLISTVTWQYSCR